MQREDARRLHNISSLTGRRRGGEVVDILKGRWVFLGSLILLIFVFALSLSNANAASNKDPNRDIVEGNGWIDGGWVVEMAQGGRFPAVTEGRDGEMQIFWTVNDQVGPDGTHFIFVFHRTITKDAKIIRDTAIIESISVYDPNNMAFLLINDVFTDKEHNSILILQLDIHEAGYGNNTAYYLKTDIDGNVLVKIREIPLGIDANRENFGAALDDLGFLHYVYAAKINKIYWANSLWYCTIAPDGRIAASPTRIVFIDDWALIGYPNVLIHDSHIYVVFSELYHGLRMTSFKLEANITPGPIVALPHQTAGGGHDYVPMGLFLDDQDPVHIVVPCLLDRYYGAGIILSEYDLEGKVVRLLGPVWGQIDDHDWLGNWRIWRDSHGTLQIIWSAVRDVQKSGHTNYLFYSAIDADGQPLIRNVQLTDPSGYFPEWSEFAQTPSVLPESDGTIRLIYDSPHMNEWRIGYIYTNPLTDLSVELEHVLPIDVMNLTEDVTLQMEIIVKNRGFTTVEGAFLVTTGDELTLICRLVLPQIAPGNLARRSCQWKPPWYHHDLTISVNGITSTDRFPENNQREFEIFVHPFPNVFLEASRYDVPRKERVTFHIIPVPNYANYDFIIDFGDGNKFQGKGPKYEIFHQYPELGVYYTSVKVWDHQGFEKTVHGPSITVFNRPPKAFITTPSPGSEFREGQEILFSAKTGTDPDDDLTYFEWDSNIDGPFLSGPEGSVRLTWGHHHITLAVCDHYGSVSRTAIDIYVNMRPIAVISSPSDTTTRITRTQFFGGNSFDDEDILYYNFEFGDNVSTGWQSSSTGEHTFGYLGIFHIRLQVIDHHGFVSEWKYCTIRVVNVLPMGNLEANNTMPHAWQGVLINVSGLSDADGWVSRTTFDYGDGIKETFYENLTNATHVFRHPGACYEIKVTLMDSSNGVIILTGLRICVENSPPMAIITNISNTIVTHEKIRLDGEGSKDLDGRIVTYLWFYDDGKRTAKGSRTSVSFDEAGMHTIRLKVIDDLGASNITTLNIFVLPEIEGKKVKREIPWFQIMIILFAAFVMIVIMTLALLKKGEQMTDNAQAHSELPIYFYDSEVFGRRDPLEDKQLLEKKTEEFYRYFSNERI